MAAQSGKTIRNSAYVMLEKVLKMGTYLIAGTLLARLAGPEIFGQYSSYLATSVIFTVFASLGLNSLLVKEFFRCNAPRMVMTNAFLLRVQAAAISGLVLALVVIWVIGAKLTVGLLAFALVPIATFQIADCFFESRQQMQAVLLYKACGYIFGLILKVGVAAYSPDPAMLLAAHLLEMCLIFAGAARSMLRVTGRPQRIDVDRAYQKQLFWHGMPLLLSSVAVVLYMKIDVIMVLRLSSAEDSGFYAAGTRLCEALFILSTPIIISTFPRLLVLFDSDPGAYRVYMRRVVSVLAGLGLFVALATYLLSDPVVAFLYGPEYAVSAEVMRIYALSIPMIFVGDLFSRWLVLSDNLHLSLQRHGVGLVTNIVLNLLLIPSLGSAGAAIASVASYAAAIVAFSLLHPEARHFYSFLGPE